MVSASPLIAIKQGAQTTRHRAPSVRRDTTTRTRRIDPTHKRRYMAKRFMGKYLSMNEEQQKAVRQQVKAFINKNVHDHEFITLLKAELNKLVKNPSDTPISRFVKKVNTLPTKQEKIAFLKRKWREIDRESRRRLVMKAAFFVGFADAVNREGLTDQFKNELASIKDRLMKLEAKGSVPAESKKVTAELRAQEEIPTAEETDEIL